MTGLEVKTLHYTVYETTNLVNSKTYIGKHITTDPNDSYLGSGKLLKASIDKYGEEWFEKTVLFVFETEDEMNCKEAELVTEEFCSLSSNYNLCPGGKGGWGYVNTNLPPGKLGKPSSELQKSIARETLIRYNKSDEGISRARKGKKDTFTNKKHTDETKKLMSEKAKLRISENSSSFGSMWITNGSENRKIKKIDIIPENWYKGRITRR